MSNLTDKQKAVLDSFLDTGCKADTARDLGLARSSVRNHIKAIEAKGEAPWLSGAVIPEHLAMTKTTVQYNGKGEVIQEWKRLSPELDMLNDVVDGLLDKVRGKGKAKKRKDRKSDRDEILFELDIFDAHVGMFAEERETRDKNYDCNIAYTSMIQVAEGLAARSNRPAKCVVVFGGDMLHSDNRSNKTEHSGNVLDVDGQHHRAVEYIISACREVVQIAASIAETVEVVVLQGNHSWHSELWLARVLRAYYDQCPNVKIVVEDSPRVACVWGDNLLVWAHGDKIAAPKWAQLVATEFAPEWGATKHRHLKMGHVHHQKTIAPVVVQEQAGIIVEYLPALCASDAWHTGAGFVGTQKGACAFEYHKEKGCMTRFFEPI